MTVKNPKDLFVLLLSGIRQREERSADLFKEMSEIAKDPDIKEALESRVFLKSQTISTLDRCFKLIDEQPVQIDEKFHDVFVEDFRRELAEIQSPAVKALYVLAKAKHVTQLRIGEYVALIAMADITGHFGVGVLLEACLADKLAFMERTRRFVRRRVESEVAARVAA